MNWDSLNNATKLTRLLLVVCLTSQGHRIVHQGLEAVEGLKRVYGILDSLRLCIYRPSVLLKRASPNFCVVKFVWLLAHILLSFALIRVLVYRIWEILTWSNLHRKALNNVILFEITWCWQEFVKWKLLVWSLFWLSLAVSFCTF